MYIYQDVTSCDLKDSTVGQNYNCVIADTGLAGGLVSLLIAYASFEGKADDAYDFKIQFRTGTSNSTL